MKDHLNVNANSFGKPVLGRAHHTGNRPAVKDNEKNETIYEAGEPTDTVDTTLKGLNLFDLSEVEDMDAADVAGHLNFIRNQAKTAQGRGLMSSAHRTVDPKQVMQLF